MAATLKWVDVVHEFGKYGYWENPNPAAFSLALVFDDADEAYNFFSDMLDVGRIADPDLNNVMKSFLTAIKNSDGGS